MRAIAASRARLGKAVRRLLVAAPLCLLGTILFPSSSEAIVSCSFSGTAVSVATTQREEGVGVSRAGQQIIIAARSLFGPEVLVPCAGGTPTVTNTDSITVNAAPGVKFSNAGVDLSGGPLAPGATPEGDGTSEIEMKLNLPGKFSSADIAGSGGADRFTFGLTAGGVPAANLNAAAEAAGDADVEVIAEELLVFGGQGADVVSTGGGTGFSGPLPSFAFLAAGGRGADQLLGGPGFEALIGDRGKDTLIGAGGSDLLDGGRGKDFLSAGSGRDIAISLRGGRDRVRCGSGHDKALTDRRDRTSGCERERHPRRAADVEEAFAQLFSRGAARAAAALR